MKTIYKRLLILLVLIGLLFVFSGCNDENLGVYKQKGDDNTVRYVMILMPDGTVVNGLCTYSLRISGNWIIVTVNDITYRLNDWRVVIKEEEKK